MILGLDISTTITGATILDEDGNIIYCEAWRTNKKNLTFFQKLDIIKHKLLSLTLEYHIEHVFIEEPLLRFAAGRSQAHTIGLIQRFNGVVTWMCRDLFGFDPKHLNASSSRKTLGIKIPRGSDTKHSVLQHILDNEPSFKVQYTRYNNPKPGTYDRADSYVVAKVGWINIKS
tara:strand:- start:214 stop:732 length:519 start_codon:yes stop_codon:yes gene_type:complete